MTDNNVLKPNKTDWRRRDLNNKRYVYVWADGVNSNVRMDGRVCLLVIIGSGETGGVSSAAGCMRPPMSWRNCRKLAAHQNRQSDLICICYGQTKNCQNEKLWQPDNNTNDGIQANGNSTENWFRLRGYNLLADVINGIKFVNGIKRTADQKQNAA